MQARWRTIAVNVSALLAAALALFGAATLASAGDTKTVSVKASTLTDNSGPTSQGGCIAGGGAVESWHFVINGLSEAEAPASISVTWDTPATASVPLAFFAGGGMSGAAHYETTLNAGSVVTNATAVVPEDWSGQFVLSHVSCGEPPAEALPSSVVTTVKRDVDGVPTEVSNALPAPVGATVYDTAVVDTTPTGATLPTGSTVEFSFFTNNTCEGTATATASLDAGGKTAAADVGPALSQVIATEGGYSYIANFVSGDVSKVLSSKGACEPFLAEAEPPAEAVPSSIVTTVYRDVDGVPTEVTNVSPAPAGSTVSDSAKIDTVPTGVELPAGSVANFSFFPTNDCSGAASATASVDVGTGTTLVTVGNALPQGPLSGGAYSYRADFVSGDITKVLNSFGTCEPFTVTTLPQDASIVTTVKRDVDGVPTEVSNTLPAPAGATVYDTAIVDTTPTGLTLPTGSKVQFNYFTDNACSELPVATITIDVGGEVAPASIGPALPQGPLAEGGYSYIADFTSGDAAVLQDAAGACEPFLVSSSPPASGVPASIVTTVKRDVDGVPTEVSNALPAPVGATVYDTAVLDTVPTGTTLPTGSNVQFSFFLNNTCAGSPVVTASIGVGGQTTLTNVGPALAQSSLTEGSYSYKANFVSGDTAVVLDATGACEPFAMSGGSTTESSTPGSNGGSNGGTADGTNPTAYLFLDPVTPPEGAGTFPPLGSPNYQSDPALAICNKPVLTPEEQAYCFSPRG